ncbi:response regulator [uncultured Clostridium sp.]|uniref:response regulator n=1 Tax=uncultured Clostridium sp. TaxID=59620 RepID=UPI00262C4922|nr:response regulator [uncultured Clostridium sp.]
MIKVLIVEDDPMVALINRKYLEMVGEVEVLGPVLSKEEVFDVLDKEKIDLIIMDVFLPKENGLEILKEMREEEILTDVIMVTAANRIDEFNKAFSLGIVDYLVKPFEFDRFKEGVEKFKKKREMLKSRKEVNQDILDNLLNLKNVNEFKNEEEELPKGLNCRTLRRIVEFLKDNEERVWTLRELAGNIKISNVTIKKYMDYLEEKNFVYVDITSGNVGRPELKYKLRK